MDGYAVGQRPPELADDGSFQTPMGVRAYSIVAENGDILSVDKETGLLVEDDAED